MRAPGARALLSIALALCAAFASAADPAKAQEWAQRGHTLWKVDKAKAIDAFTRAIDADPGFYAARYDRALLCMETDRAEEAMRDLKALEEAGRPEAEKLRGLMVALADAHTSIAGKALEDEDYALALAKLRAVLVYDPNHADAYTVRGAVHARQGRTKEALADYERAMQLDPRSPEPVFNRGLLRLRQGQHAQAVQDFTRAIELEPREPSGYRGRAEAYRGLGDAARARRDEEQADRLEAAAGAPAKDVRAP